jgi:RHS repeat-associated protein
MTVIAYQTEYNHTRDGAYLKARYGEEIYPLSTSREWDNESQTIHHRYRNNDPRIGRFLSADPMGYDGGINLYSYVKNNPVNRIDPRGLQDIAPTWDVVRGTGYIFCNGLFC